MACISQRPLTIIISTIWWWLRLWMVKWKLLDGHILPIAAGIQWTEKYLHTFRIMMMMMIAMMIVMPCCLRGCYICCLCVCSVGLSWKLRARCGLFSNQARQDKPTTQSQDYAFRAQIISLEFIQNQDGDAKTGKGDEMFCSSRPWPSPSHFGGGVVKPWIMHFQATSYGTAVSWLNLVKFAGPAGLAGHWVTSRDFFCSCFKSGIRPILTCMLVDFHMVCLDKDAEGWQLTSSWSDWGWLELVTGKQARQGWDGMGWWGLHSSQLFCQASAAVLCLTCQCNARLATTLVQAYNTAHYVVCVA